MSILLGGNIMNKSPITLNIEEIFGRIMSGGWPVSQSNLASIGHNLNLIKPGKYTVRVIDNKEGTFFGMSVYPSIPDAERLVENLDSTNKLNAVWADIRNWTIEIDSNLLFNKTLDTSPGEVTAILLHEVGHVHSYNLIPSRVKRVTDLAFAKGTIRVRKLLNWKKMTPMYVLLVLEACKTTFADASMNKNERKADFFVTKFGYSEDLKNFLDKLLLYGNDVNNLIMRSERDVEQDMEVLMNWIIVNIASLEFRRTELDKNLQQLRMTTPSILIHQALDNIRERFFHVSTVRRVERVALETTLAREYMDLEKQPYTVRRLPKTDIPFIPGKLMEADFTIIENQVLGCKTRSDQAYAILTLNNMIELVYEDYRRVYGTKIQDDNTFFGEDQDLSVGGSQILNGNLGSGNLNVDKKLAARHHYEIERLEQIRGRVMDLQFDDLDLSFYEIERTACVPCSAK